MHHKKHRPALVEASHFHSADVNDIQAAVHRAKQHPSGEQSSADESGDALELAADWTQQDDALDALLERLTTLDYEFVAPTPATQAIVLERPATSPPSLRDVLGWNRAFESAAIDSEVLRALRRANAIVEREDRSRARLRVSTLDGLQFVHSAYPTMAKDSIFFGPDTYRFARFVKANVPPGATIGRIADVGAGTGAGALVAARRATPAEVVLTDVNERALRVAALHARRARVDVSCVRCEGLEGVTGAFDLVLANPPYIVDREARDYRDGGALYGGEASVQMARAALRRLKPRGSLLLYTGAAIVSGHSPLAGSLARLASEERCTFSYEEIDPDVFGEELRGPAYAAVDRIAAIGVIITRS